MRMSMLFHSMGLSQRACLLKTTCLFKNIGLAVSCAWLVLIAPAAYGISYPPGFLDALEVKHEAARNGDACVQYDLGEFYTDRFEDHVAGGIKSDHKAAAEYYLSAAQLGHRDAQYRLAGVYKIGKGVPKNDAESEKWLIKAAAGNHVEQRVACDLAD